MLFLTPALRFGSVRGPQRPVQRRAPILALFWHLRHPLQPPPRLCVANATFPPPFSKPNRLAHTTATHGDTFFAVLELPFFVHHRLPPFPAHPPRRPPRCAAPRTSPLPVGDVGDMVPPPPCRVSYVCGTCLGLHSSRCQPWPSFGAHAHLFSPTPAIAAATRDPPSSLFFLLWPQRFSPQPRAWPHADSMAHRKVRLRHWSGQGRVSLAGGGQKQLSAIFCVGVVQ